MSKNKVDKASMIYIIAIIVLLVIGLVVLIVSIVLRKSPEEQYALEKYNDPDRIQVYEAAMKEKIWPNGMIHLKNNYGGKNDLDDFYIILKSFGDFTVDLSNDKIITKSNSEEIMDTLKYDFRVQNPEKVMEFYKGKNYKNILTCSVDGDTMDNQRDGLVFNMTFDYNDGQDKVLYQVKILNRLYSDKFAEFTLIGE